MRTYPELHQESIASVFTDGGLPNQKTLQKHVHASKSKLFPLEETLRDVFQKKYPGEACIDPAFDSAYYEKVNSLSFTTKEEAYEHWLNEGKQQGLSYAPGKSTAIAIVLKTYNEDFFITEWLEYYKKVIGLENVLVLDHGSTSPQTLAAYKKYEKELLIINVPRTVEHDFLHNTKRFNLFFDVLKHHYLFFTLLDTDEFLCRFNGERIVSHGIPERIQSLKDEKTLGTVWLTNYFTGVDTPTVFDITQFNIKDQPLRHNLATSKNIFRYDQTHEIIGHNRAIPNIAITPDLLLLHVKRGSLAVRIQSQVNACISFGIIDADDTKEAMIEKLQTSEQTEIRHGARELLAYLTDTPAYIQKMTDIDVDVCLTTNIIAETVRGDTATYNMVHPAETSPAQLIANHFNQIIDRFEPWSHLAKRSTS